jgi:uncharacterized protein (DUF952 family)
VSDERLFHLIVRANLDAARRGADDAWRPASLRTEGFVHLSFARQLRGTLEVHFAAADEVLLVEVDARSVADALRLEASRGGERFPHVYRALAWSELVRWWTLARASDAEADGVWRVPRLGPTASSDDPPGRDSG